MGILGAFFKFWGILGVGHFWDFEVGEGLWGHFGGKFLGDVMGRFRVGKGFKWGFGDDGGI